MEMRLDEKPFNLIKKGIKEVEYRLNDDKRKQIKIGDIIVFTNRNTQEQLKVKVIDLKYYKNLLDMFTDTFDLYLKNDYQTPLEAVKDITYYTEEEISKYGCVAIFIKLI